METKSRNESHCSGSKFQLPFLGGRPAPDTPGAQTLPGDSQLVASIDWSVVA